MNLSHEFKTALNENREFMAALNSWGERVVQGFKARNRCAGNSPPSPLPRGRGEGRGEGEHALSEN